MTLGCHRSIPMTRPARLRLAALFAAALLGLALPAQIGHAAGGGGCALPANTATLRTQLLAGLNAERTARGLAPLRLNAALDKAAQGHACDNAKRRSISHQSSDGSQLQHRLRRVGYGYRTAAENTGRGFATPQRAVEWWMNSPHHKDNILLGAARDVGIGIALSPAPENRLHWVIDMGTTR